MCLLPGLRRCSSFSQEKSVHSFISLIVFCVPDHMFLTVQSAGKNGSDNSQMEFEAKSARDGAWLVFDLHQFRNYRSQLVCFDFFFPTKLVYFVYKNTH